MKIDVDLNMKPFYCEKAIYGRGFCQFPCDGCIKNHKKLTGKKYDRAEEKAPCFRQPDRPQEPITPPTNKEEMKKHAIEFAEWMSDEDFSYCGGGKYGKSDYSHRHEISELYHIFLSCK